MHGSGVLKLFSGKGELREIPFKSFWEFSNIGLLKEVGQEDREGSPLTRHPRHSPRSAQQWPAKDKEKGRRKNKILPRFTKPLLMRRQQILRAEGKGAALREVFQSLESQEELERKRNSLVSHKAVSLVVKQRKIWHLGCKT